jgi:rhomboid protease GluP
VTGFCAVLYAVTLMWGGISMGGGLFGMLSPSQDSVFVFGASGAIPIFKYGRFWTPLSRDVAPRRSPAHRLQRHVDSPARAGCRELYGPGRMVIIYTIAGIAGFTASSLAGWFLPFLPWPLSGAI